MVLWVGKLAWTLLGDSSLGLGWANSYVWSQLLDLLGLVGLIHFSAERTHLHSFTLSFSRVLAWACSYGGGRVPRTTGKRTNSNVQSLFKSLHFSCLLFVSGAKASHMTKPRVNVGGDRACEKFECITAAVYHPGFAKPATCQYGLGRILEEGISCRGD